MGRTPTTIRIDGELFRKILKDHDLNFSDRAKSYGVSKQAMNQWFGTGRIPPRALIEIALELGLVKDQLDRIIINTKDELAESLPKRKWQITMEEL